LALAVLACPTPLAQAASDLTEFVPFKTIEVGGSPVDLFADDIFNGDGSGDLVVTDAKGRVQLIANDDGKTVQSGKRRLRRACDRSGGSAGDMGARPVRDADP
jgi:hypothetical protein